MAKASMTLFEIMAKFPDDETAEAWFAGQRWPDGKPACPHCGSANVQSGCSHRTMPYRCREKECGKRFSLKTGTVMQSSKLGLRVWAIAMFILTSNVKGASSLSLHRDLGVTAKTAWHLAHRIRESWQDAADPPPVEEGPAEVDEAYFGGLEKNKHWDKKLRAGRGTVGKTPVAGVLDRATNRIHAAVVPRTDRATLEPLVMRRTRRGTPIHTDEAAAYDALPNHEAVNHGRGEYVRGDVHVNGVESFWAMLKRGHKGIYHQWSPKHLHRYVTEFAGRHNLKPLGTDGQMAAMAAGMVGRRLRYRDLTGEVS